MENSLDLSLKTIRGMEFLDTSIKILNRDIMFLVEKSSYEKNYLVGVKNSNNIDRSLIKKLCDSSEFIWHTVDKGSDRGRAIDINLKNPITGTVMTGSSSGTAINVLYGINDLGLGTDGGGSLIYPAISLNLYSLMGKGIGLSGKYSKKSTDNIEFTPGIGFISHDFDIIKNAIKKVGYNYEQSKEIISVINSEKNDELKYNKNIKIGIIKKNSEKIENSDLLNKIKLNYYKREIKIENEFSDDRIELIEQLKKIFEKNDIIITYEHDIETDGLGDSVFGTLGSKSRKSQKQSNKILGKVANMMNLTVITIPDSRLSSGVLILAKEGINYGLEAIKIASNLSSDYLPELYYKYFKNSYRVSKNSMIFDL